MAASLISTSSNYPFEKYQLASSFFWEKYWENISLPSEIVKSNKNLFINELLYVIDKFFPINHHFSILEIGGAPGRYLAYMAKTFHYSINCLDASRLGCIKTNENFILLNIKGNVYHENIFSINSLDPLFDIVYSLGFVEHFKNPEFVIKRHLDFLKPGGLLLIGMPNLLGINYLLLKKLAPMFLSGHNLTIMDVFNWKSFEKLFGLKLVFKGYVGGFEPSILKKCENMTTINSILYRIVTILDKIFSHHMKLLRKLNSRYFSAYVIGIYRKAKTY